MTLVFNAMGGTLMAAVGTVLNTAPTILQGPVGGRLEQRLKMHLPPEAPGGGHRYEQVKTVSFEPNQSAAALMGLHRALRDRPDKDHVSAFHIADDPADAEMGWLVSATGLVHEGSETPAGPIQGYTEDVSVGYYTRRIDAVRQAIEEIPGAMPAISNAQESYDVPGQWQY